MKKIEDIGLEYLGEVHAQLHKGSNVGSCAKLHHFTNSNNGTICVSGGEWEEVSTSYDSRCFSYEEMARVKDDVFGKNEIAMQIHPAKSFYINLHKYCLHLFRNSCVSTKAEEALKRRFEQAYEMAKGNYVPGQKQSIAFECDDTKFVAIYCGENWLTWEEVCEIKQAFWEPEEAAVQLNINYEFDINPEHILLLMDAQDVLVPF